MRKTEEDRENFYIGWFMCLCAIAERPHLLPPSSRPKLIKHMVGVGVGALITEVEKEVKEIDAPA